MCWGVLVSLPLKVKGGLFTCRSFYCPQLHITDQCLPFQAAKSSLYLPYYDPRGCLAMSLGCEPQPFAEFIGI